MEFTENMKTEFSSLEKEYRDYLDVYEKKSIVRQVKGKVTESDLYAVAKKLDNTKKYMEFTEANGGLGDLGALQQISLGVVLGADIQDVTPLFAGVQPLDSEVGLIYFKKVVSKTDKAGNTIGQDLLSTKTGRTAYFNAADGLAEETVATGDGTTTSFAATLMYAPVLRRYVEVHLSSDPTIKAVDDGNGVLLGNGVSGTIDYETGAITLDFLTAPAAGDGIVVTYQTSYGADTMDELPYIQSEYDSIKVTARTFALRSEFSLLKMFSMAKKFGTDIKEMLAKDLTNELQAVVASNAIRKAYQATAMYTPVTFNAVPPSGVSSTEHRLSFLTNVIPALQGAVLDESGRFTGMNTIVAGSKVATYIMGLPGFQPAGYQFNALGSIFVGTLNGMPVIRTDVIPANEALFFAKGTSPLEAGLVVAPYIPVFMAEMNGINKNALRQSKAIATAQGFATPIPGMIARLQVTGL